MGKKIKIAILLLAVYLLIFWIGFKSGVLYLRMHNKVQLERVEIPGPILAGYIVVEKPKADNYTYDSMRLVDENNVFIKVFMNEKLRPLLKRFDVEIYKETGERIY